MGGPVTAGCLAVLGHQSNQEPQPVSHVAGVRFGELWLLGREDGTRQYAGLKKLGSDEATAIWTVSHVPKHVQAAIEVRANERHAFVLYDEGWSCW